VVLRRLIDEHEELLKVAALHRSAIGNADARLMADCLNVQGAAAERILGLERERQAMVAALVGKSGVSPKARITLSQLAKGLSDPVRSRLLAAGEGLREVLNKLHQEHTAIRSAATALSSHMEGLMRQVCRRLSHAGTYARSGSVDAGVAVVTAVDLRS
jgi:hypothetical protein